MYIYVVVSASLSVSRIPTVPCQCLVSRMYHRRSVQEATLRVHPPVFVERLKVML